MKGYLRIALASLAVAVLAGCTGDDGDDGMNGMAGSDGFNSLVATRDLPLGDADCPGGGTALDSGLDTNRNDVLDASEVTATDFLDCERAPQLRALHASNDAPNVNIIVNGATALTDVPYYAGSGFLPVAESTQVQVEAIIPGGNAIVIDETLTLDFNTEHTVIATGPVAAPVSAWVISNPAGELIFPGNFRAQIVHAASSAPPVDVYLTLPGDDLTMAMPLNAAPFAYQDATEQIEAAAGTYQIRITPAGDPATVVYDSGSVDLAADADLLIAALDNTGPGANLVQLVILDGAGATTLLDTNTPAAVVAVHASPDAGTVDLLADAASTAADDAIPLASGVPFPATCLIETVPGPESYTISVTAAGDPSMVALTFPFDAEQAAEAMAIVTGYAASTPALQPLALASDTRAIATETKLRVTHGAGSTAEVDIYLVADGTDFNDAATVPAFTAVPFGADTGILSIVPGTYDVYVTPTGTKSVIAIEVQDLPLSGSQVLDVIARDPADDGSEGTLPQLILIDYATLGACTV